MAKREDIRTYLVQTETALFTSLGALKKMRGSHVRDIEKYYLEEIRLVNICLGHFGESKWGLVKRYLERQIKVLRERREGLAFFEAAFAYVSPEDAYRTIQAAIAHLEELRKALPTNAPK